MKTATTLSNRQQGSTLIEIMVSMFILALGLMALLAMQTRTSAAIKEAENQTIIAQATENLAENMMAYPVLGLSSGQTLRNYTAYNKDIKCGSISPPASKKTDGKVSDFVDDHLYAFANTVCNINGIDKTDAEFKVEVKDGKTLKVEWTVLGSSNKKYSYDYPLDNNE